MSVPTSRYIVFGLVASGGALVDLASKSAIFAWRGMPHEQHGWWLFENVFGVTTSLNEGALFGVGQGQVALFTLLSLAAGLAILYWLFVLHAARDWLLTCAMGAVTAGILGNLYDRVGLPGLRWGRFPNEPHQVGEPVFAVRDWIHFHVEPIGSWPIFNIADSLLVCGVGLLLWHSWRGEPAENTATVAASVPTDHAPARGPATQGPAASSGPAAKAGAENGARV